MTTITFVGTGSAFSRRFGHSNAMVRKGDIGLMLDFGFLSPSRLGKQGVALDAISHLAISHLHADHIGGLEELAFMSYFVLGTRPVLLLPEPLQGTLWQQSLRGGLEWVSDGGGAPLRRGLSDYFEVETLQEGRWQRVGDLSVLAFPVDHVPGRECYGFAVRDEEDGRQLVYTSDTRVPLSELQREDPPAPFDRGPIFHDCQLFDGGPGSIHVFLGDLERYPTANRERVVLTHYGDQIEEHLERIRELGFRVVWPGTEISLPSWRECLDGDPRSGS